MGWCGNCCGAPGGEGEQGQGAAGHGAEQNNSSVRNVIYNRVGRVEKSKHGGKFKLNIFVTLKIFSCLVFSI